MRKALEFICLAILISLLGQAQVPRAPEVKRLKVLSATAIPYPWHFERNKIEEVLVKVTVNEEGTVDSAEFVSGDRTLATEATKEAMKWKFEPFLREGKAIRVATRLPVTFVPKLVKVDEEVLKRRQSVMVNPTYPPLARSARIEGSVVLYILVGRDGKVLNLRSLSGHPMLVPAAIEAVKEWRYEPYLLKGLAVEVQSEVTVKFSLSN